ncbi:MAG: ABC transporter ATP-binding protein [Dehalococcoidia bacterium]
MASLAIKNVRKSFGALDVLSNIDIELEDGGFLVLLGPSGCGKSTLLSIIAGLEASSGGNVRIGDRNVNDVKPKDRNIAMVFQSYALYPTMTVERNIGFGLEMRQVDRETRGEAVRKAAELLQIGHLLERKPSQLSGGQRQRVAMGRAIVREPDLFLFDEPLSNLDAKLRVEMRTEIKRLHNQLRTTIVYVTHDQVEAMTLGTKVAVMKDGIIQQFDDPQTIYDRPANVFVAGFIGSPSMNMLEGQIVERDGQIVVQHGADRESVLDLTGGFQDLNPHLGMEVLVGIRPEALSLSGSRATLEGTIDVVEPTGPDTLAVINVSGQFITARLSPRDRPQMGDRIKLAVEVPAACVFSRETRQLL